MKDISGLRYTEINVTDSQRITDVHGRDSAMVYIPSFSLSDVMEDGGDEPHPAFVVNGRALSGIYISKYQNTVLDGCAYSIPNVDPAVLLDFDAARAACTAKGKGWHLMTAMEWGAIALWCLKNGWLPLGNNDFGRDIRESTVTATISYRDEEAGICRIATGSGPVTWSHNRREDGIYDLNGNVWEWSAGMRLVCGELQLLPDNNGADASYSQAADSDAWRAIDARTGAYISPRGDGRTENSVKLDYIGGIFTYTAGEPRDSYAHARFCDFSAVRADDSVSEPARRILRALGCLPTGGAEYYAGVSFYANNGARERMVFRGGRYGQGYNAGILKTCIDDPRGYAGQAVGFRAAYYEV